MRLDSVKDLIGESQGYKKLKEGQEKGRYPVGVYGISDSARALLISKIFRDSDKSVFVFSDSDLNARQIYEDLILYETEVYYLPAREAVFYNADALSGDLRWERLRVIREITGGGKKIIVTSAEVLASKYMPHSYYERYTFRIRKGDILDPQVLAIKLTEMGYERTEVTEMKGQFSLRGGIMDLWSPAETFPSRIELFGNEIDTIRSFNPETQRSLDSQEETFVFPAREIILDKATLIRGRNRIREDFEEVKKNKTLRKTLGDEGFSKLTEITDRNLESLEENWSFETIDSYLTYFFPEAETFFSYMGDSVAIVDSPERTMGKVGTVVREFSEKYETYLKRGEILPGQGDILLDFNETEEGLKESHLITLSEFKKTAKYLAPLSTAEFNVTGVYNFHGQLDMMMQDITDRKEAGYRILILSGTRSRGERFMDTLRENGIESVYRDVPGTIPEKGVVITFGNQKKGFEFRDIKFALYSDSEVFGETREKRKTRKPKGRGIEKIKSFDELKKGEYVVHVNHGIGVYMGIKQMKSMGAMKDYLEISYGGSDRLFIPVDQLDLLQKYIGNEGAEPSVSKLSTNEWSKAKAKAKQSIDKTAKEIVELYARRSKVKGFMFSEDSDWQKEFEDEFPYEETGDQLLSVEEIKKDMESSKVMDRLLCGDVGFGKTEVAMRAAFKAVMDSKQVAVLVPTTILAEQHYKNFVRRFEGFPVAIDMVSRFRTPKRVKETLEALKEGNLDIIVGTHKLLSKNVIFKDLGLLIVDEEQRFGVRHKERLKELKNTVDVLTLSATPIPRTLNMSMTGIRDISLIETPPEDRFPIQTYVMETNDQLIRDAVLKELGRKGQVYFVYNRVAEIEHMAAYLKKLIPEATFGVAHGQLGERELENRMVSFMDGEIDVLVCSTIIETGLDIQNVNTIIIHDADKMGLSQLYQLRGRVGRTNRIAYAYLTYRRDKVLTEVAEKRLKALKDFTELGAGFRIAMKDLEIRGAGNMMGKAQHGHMAAIGYDLYIRMLDDAVKKLTGEKDETVRDTLVDIKIDAFIPFSYIKDETVKIQVYRKIASIESTDDYMRVKEELEDRFGEIPPQVYNLMDIAETRSMAGKCGVREIRDNGSQAVITFASKEAVTDGFIGVFLNEFRDSIRIDPEAQKISGENYRIIYKYKGEKQDLISGLKRFFKKLLYVRDEEKKAEKEKAEKDKAVMNKEESLKEDA